MKVPIPTGDSMSDVFVLLQAGLGQEMSAHGVIKV